MVLSGATGCESSMPEDADGPANDPGPNSPRVTGLDEKVRRLAASDNKRRARDSNSQPLAGHHISSVAANHSLTLQTADVGMVTLMGTPPTEIHHKDMLETGRGDLLV